DPLLQAVLSQQPDDVEVVRALARNRMFAKQLDEAEDYLNRWIELRPDDIGARNHRIGVALERKRLSLAIADARAVLELDPTQLGLRVHLVGWLINVGEYDEAERQCLLGEKQRPGQWNLVLLRAEIV